MATIVRYVNPGSSGGNGTTSALTGANAAYASLNAWEAAENTNLDTANNIMQVNCAGTTADTTACTIDGWTTSGTDYIEIAGNWNGDKWDTNFYILDVTVLGGQGGVIDVREDFVRIHNLQINYSTDTAASRFGICIRNNYGDVSNGRFYIYNNYITRASALSSGLCHGVNWDYSTNTSIAYIYNNIVTNYSHGLYMNIAGQTMYAENNTFRDITIGGFGSDGTALYLNAGIMVAINNLVSNCNFCGSGAFTNSDYNATNLASLGYTGDGGNSHTSHTFTFTSTTPTTSGYLHLASNDTGALDLGTSSVNGGFTTDIDGVTRTDTWDIGADEYVAAGTTVTPYGYLSTNKGFW